MTSIRFDKWRFLAYNPEKLELDVILKKKKCLPKRQGIKETERA